LAKRGYDIAFSYATSLKDADLDYMINLDFRNYIVMMRAAAKYMITHGIRGTIVNTTSSRGERAYPDGESVLMKSSQQNIRLKDII